MKIVDLFTVACFLLGTISAGLVALHPNILYAAIALIFSLLSVAGLYGVLGADFLAAAQLIIYVGGIIVVILFAIMMSENIYRTRFIDIARRLVAPFVFCLFVFGALFELFRGTNWDVKEQVPAAVPTLESIGRALTGPYALPFQYVAIVLLVGLVVAVIVARPHYHDDESQKGRKG